MKKYKVVCFIRSNKRISVAAEGKASVEYYEGKWVKAPEWLWQKGYGLVVFDNKLAAESFWEECLFKQKRIELWVVEAKGRIKKLPPMLQIDYLRLGKLKPDFCNWPLGTEMYKQVKLLKRLK